MIKSITCFLNKSAWVPRAGSVKAMCWMTSSIDQSDGSGGSFGGLSDCVVDVAASISAGTVNLGRLISNSGGEFESLVGDVGFSLFICCSSLSSSSSSFDSSPRDQLVFVLEFSTGSTAKWFNFRI